MTLLQRLVHRFLPRRWSAAIEAESRAWQLVCDCGQAVSVWEAGGIRFGGRGRPRRAYCCSRCGVTAHRLEKRESAATDAPGD